MTKANAKIAAKQNAVFVFIVALCIAENKRFAPLFLSTPPFWRGAKI
jgi:hypothetical protein